MGDMTREIAFTKGHGTENDFVLVPDLDGARDLTPETVAALADRRAGIGGDGVIRIVPAASAIEAEVREDCGHYFEELNKWERMVVYVYDDADRSEPERWYSLRDALMRFDRRIVEVLIVQRPSCLPPRA